jgi:MoaA/NifB/PqqE/SkfB family radical SAM enzyme
MSETSTKGTDRITELPQKLQLEITLKCQQECRHCFNKSGPAGTHGSMTVADWRRVIDQAAELNIQMLQFIGGEPTMHPGLAELISHALDADRRVEVYSNLVHVTPAMWAIFTRPGLNLATSWYSDDPAQHATITGRPTFDRIKSNIAAAVQRGIPIRVGIVAVDPGQRVAEAKALLASMGVLRVSVDRVRHLGRAADEPAPKETELCGAFPIQFACC